MKERQIKVWPETVHYLPSISPFQALSGEENDIRIDFSGCQQITSTGLTVLLLRLMRLLDNGTGKRRWAADNIDGNPVFATIQKLGFFNHLKNTVSENVSLLGASKTDGVGPFEKTEHEFLNGRKVTSFPIIRLDFNNYKSERRAAIKVFKKELHKCFDSIELSYQIHANQLIAMFSEMAKNSADHTSGDAFFGIDLIHIPEKGSGELHFVLGDLGKGIKQHIQDHLPNHLKSTRSPHWSLYESYRYALTNGYTSTPERQTNKGLGMTIILEGAKGVKMSLSVFDAESRGMLSSLKDTTHEELRRHFIAFTKHRVFYYYGSVEVRPYEDHCSTS